MVDKKFKKFPNFKFFFQTSGIYKKIQQQQKLTNLRNSTNWVNYETWLKSFITEEIKKISKKKFFEWKNWF